MESFKKSGEMPVGIGNIFCLLGECLNCSTVFKLKKETRQEVR